MPTKKYRTSNGVRVPGVTTIISASLGWGKEGLLHWAWDMGMQGMDYREERDTAAGIGSIAHALAEADIKGLPLPERPPDMDEASWYKAERSFDAYLAWKRMSRLSLLLSEISLVSDELRVGGTIDAIGSVNDELALIDFKTSNRTYPDHLIQLSAYKELWETGRPFEIEIPGTRDKLKGIHLLRFSKAGDFHHSYYSSDRMVLPFQCFTMLRSLYDYKKELEGMV